MVEALPNLQVVYAKWQSRNPYLRAGQPCNSPTSLYTDHGGGDSRSVGLKSWQSNLVGSQRPPARLRAANQRGRNRRENGFTDADKLMVSVCICVHTVFLVYVQFFDF